MPLERATDTPPTLQLSAGSAAQCLTFFVGEQEYAAPILTIREIVQLRPLTPVPNAPSWMRGVMNLRGTVVPVADLAAKLGFAATHVTSRTCVVIAEVQLRGETAVIGALVDAVNRVVELTEDAIEEPPAFGTAVGVECLIGMGRVDDRFLPILDVYRVLSMTEALAALPVEQANLDAEAVSSDASSQESTP